MAPAKPDWDADSLALSDDSEVSLEDVKGDQRNADFDLTEYGKSLGADVDDPVLAWVVREAFHAPLPASWVEFVDDEGRVYFFNYTSNECTWNHPLDEVYRELIAFVVRVRRSKPPPDQERLHTLIGEHLRQVYDRASVQLANWSGPYRSEDGECYYFNETSQQSTWISPMEEWEHELGIRQEVLNRCLLPTPSTGRDQAPPPATEDATVPVLKLPGPDDEVDSPRFYTPRNSARSDCSALSLTSPTGSEASPNRTRSRGRNAVSVSSVLESARLDAAARDVASGSITTDASHTQEGRIADDHLEITFGHTAAESLPTGPQEGLGLPVDPEALRSDGFKEALDREATDSGPSTAAESQGLDAKIEEVNDLEVSDETSTCAPGAAPEGAGSDELEVKEDLEASGSGPSTSAETQGTETRTDEGNTADEVRDEFEDEMEMTFGCSVQTKMPGACFPAAQGAQPKLPPSNEEKACDDELAPVQASAASKAADSLEGDAWPKESHDGTP